MLKIVLFILFKVLTIDNLIIAEFDSIECSPILNFCAIRKRNGIVYDSLRGNVFNERADHLKVAC